MPRYFFHLRGQDYLDEDSEGMDLPDLHAALDEALRVNRELTNETSNAEGLEFEITDDKNRTMLKVPVEAYRNWSVPVLQTATGGHRLHIQKRVLH